MMTESKNVFDSARNLLDRFYDAAREILGKIGFMVLVEEGSSEWQEFTRSKWPEFHWLARLPKSSRDAVRRLWEMHEQVGRLLAEAVGRTAQEEKRARLESVLNEGFGELGRVVRPAFYQAGIRSDAAEQTVDRVRQKIYPQLVTTEKETRLKMLDELVSKLGVVAEEAEAGARSAAASAAATTAPAAVVPAAKESVDLAISVDELEEASGLARRLEGSYVTLTEGLPLKKLKGAEIGDHPLLPILTPKHCFDWDPVRRSEEQDAALAEARAGYERLRGKMESALGVSLGEARPRDRAPDEGMGAASGETGDGLPPGLGGRRTSLLARRCDEALMWLGTILPVGRHVPKAWGGFTSVKRLKIFLAEKARFCFSEIRDVAKTLQDRLGQLQADAAQRALAEERTLVREAAMRRLASEVGFSDGVPGDSPTASGGTGVQKLTRPFPTPEGATWGDVAIRFRDRHSVSIQAKEVAGVYDYTRMGMVDRRNGSPTKQWELLEDFAESEGTMTWRHPAASRRNQKRREILARNLRAFFGIEGDPFCLTPDGKGWHARFTILPR